MERKELVLGTAQLGRDYGIANLTGKPSMKESFAIMQFALDNEINYFDSAYFYEDSEPRIGLFLKENPWYKDQLNIVTKMRPLFGEEFDEKIIRNRFYESLKRLGQDSIYSYLAHDFIDVKNHCKEVNKLFLQFKKEGLTEKIGVSIYEEEEVRFLLENFDFDLIQIPINIFNQRLYNHSVIEELKKRNIEIHVRSIFSQGLIFLNKSTEGAKRPTNKPWIAPVDPDNKYEKFAKRLDIICTEFGFSRAELALLFINDIKEIDKIVIGVVNPNHLQKDIKALSDNKIKKYNIVKEHINWEDFYIRDDNIINIRNWRA